MGEKKEEKKDKITPVDWGTGDEKLVVYAIGSRPMTNKEKGNQDSKDEHEK